MLFVEGSGGPSHKHETLESAQVEVTRLAKKTAKRVWVLKPQGFVEISKPRYFDTENVEILTIGED